MDETIRRIMTHWLLAAGMILISLGAASAAPVRVALVGTHGAGMAGGVVALAEAQLSARDGLEVLDRQHVDRLLKEQKLSVAGLVDAGMAIKAGQVLSADLFALVEQSTDGKETLACIVYDTGTGLRLCDDTLSGDGFEAVANEVVACVERATRKKSAGNANMRTLSVIGVRNADLPRSLDTTCESLALLFERELARSGDVALLERKRLGWLQQERTLTATDADRELLSSTLQADLQFSRQADGVRATVIVTDATGQRLHSATADAKQLEATLVPPLVESLLRGLNAKRTATPTNGLRESQRFFREAEQRWSFKEPVLAIQAAEAALLLDPGNADRMLLLAEYLLHTGSRSFWKLTSLRAEGARTLRPLTVEECRDLAASGQRGIELSDAAYRQINPRSLEELDAFYRRTMALETAHGEFFNSLPRHERITHDGRDEWRAICRELSDVSWRFSREQITRWNQATRVKPGASFAYSLAVPRALQRLERQSPFSVEVTSRALGVLDEWLTCFETLPKGHQPLVHTSFVLRAVTSTSEPPPFDLTVLEPFIERLERHSLPLLQIHGRFARLNQKWRQQSSAATECAAGLRSLRVEVLALLDRPENKSDEPMRRACYALLSQAYSGLWRFKTSPEYETEVTAICDALVARRELHPGLFLLGATGQDKLAPDTARQTLARIDAALTLSQQPNVSLVDSSNPQVTRQSLERARADFLVRHRDLLSDTPSLRVRTRLLMEFPQVRAQRVQLSAMHAAKMYAPVVSGGNVVSLVMSSRLDEKTRRPVIWLQAASIPLEPGSPTFLGEVSTSLEIRNSADTVHLVTASCVHEDRYYAATTAGLVEFDLKSTKARIIDMSEKFPAAKVQSLASFDKRLWLGLEGGYLVSFARDADEVRVLASSRRKEKLSPLDDREAFAVVGIVPDPERQRLLVLIGGKQENKSASGEFWEYRPSRDEFQRLLEFKLFPEAITPLQENRLMISSVPWVVSFDAATNRTFVVANGPLGPNLPPNRQHFIQLFLRKPVMCADRLWWSLGQALEGKLATLRLDVNDERLLPVDLPPLDKDEIYAGWYVAPVDDKRLLWSNHHRLWLVTPEGGEAKPPAAK